VFGEGNSPADVQHLWVRNIPQGSEGMIMQDAKPRIKEAYRVTQWLRGVGFLCERQREYVDWGPP